jgi:hypothetical protein
MTDRLTRICELGIEIDSVQERIKRAQQRQCLEHRRVNGRRVHIHYTCRGEENKRCYAARLELRDLRAELHKLETERNALFRKRR